MGEAEVMAAAVTGEAEVTAEAEAMGAAVMEEVEVMAEAVV